MMNKRTDITKQIRTYSSGQHNSSSTETDPSWLSQILPHRHRTPGPSFNGLKDAIDLALFTVCYAFILQRSTLITKFILAENSRQIIPHQQVAFRKGLVQPVKSDIGGVGQSPNSFALFQYEGTIIHINLH